MERIDAAKHLSIMGARKISLVFCLAMLLQAQTPTDPATASIAPVTTPGGISNERILGVIPNFQTVPDPKIPYTPLRVRDKWWLFVKETVDPYTFASSAGGAVLSQWHNTAPKYGNGVAPFFQRFGAAQADVTTQNFFGDAVLASLLHEDPRYFRMGPARSVLRRVGYALTRVVITRKDSGKNCFNFSGVGGTSFGIALSNAYYPPSSVNGPEMGSRLLTSFSSSAVGNLLPEFWPDVKERLDHWRHH
jgi:hypothetical protein